MKLGTLVKLANITEAEEKFAKLKHYGFSSCQLVYKPAVYKKEDAEYIKEVADRNGIEISAQFCGYQRTVSIGDNYYNYKTIETLNFILENEHSAKLLKNIRKIDILYIIISGLLIVFQVWLELKMPDYMANITRLVQTKGASMNDILREGSYMLLCAFGSLIASFIVGYF